MSDALAELHEILQQITGKVHGGDFEDIEERMYWQGKKDGIRLALTMLDETYEGYASILAYSQVSRFVEKEARFLGLEEVE